MAHCPAGGGAILRPDGAGPLAIAFDSASSAQTGATGATSLTWSHTVGSGSNRFLLVGVSLEGPQSSVTGVTYGGAPLTLAGGQDCDAQSCRVEIWYRLAPTSGPADIIVTAVGSAFDPNIVGGAVSYSGVSQTAPSFASVNDSSAAGCVPGTGGTASLIVPSAAGDVVVDAIAPEPVPSPAAGQTQRWNLTNWSSSHGAGSERAGAAPSVTTSWSLDCTASGGEWALAGVRLQPAGATTVALSTFGASAGASLPLALATACAAAVAGLTAWRGRSRRRGN